MGTQIDITFDFRTDTPRGKDPDTDSKTLHGYHKFLWSKPTPCGEVLDLDDTAHGHYLLHRSEGRGEFSLSSDAVVASFRYVPMVQDEPEPLDEFMYIGYTMGGMMLWPGNKVDGKMTINGARGLHPRIKDRFDLTLECIRRHYLGERSPLAEVLARYADFFRLFRDFRGFVEFFLLQDAVTADCDAVIFSAPLRDFSTSAAIPQTIKEYREYRRRAITFIEARNRRPRPVPLAARPASPDRELPHEARLSQDRVAPQIRNQPSQSLPELGALQVGGARPPTELAISMEQVPLDAHRRRQLVQGERPLAAVHVAGIILGVLPRLDERIVGNRPRLRRPLGADVRAEARLVAGTNLVPRLGRNDARPCDLLRRW